ncbi:MAG: hypothetical protein HYZ14_04830 [Bacteroidetes bacterium]|nr:hypothetical protein [Bacteroidota bacterium]
MKIPSILVYLIFIPLIGCIGNSQLSDFEDISKHATEHFTSNAIEDSVDVRALNVKMNNLSGTKDLRIFWEINEYAHVDFILEYNTMLIRTLNKKVINQLDSVILEVQIPDSDFGLKRYRASREEVNNLCREYESVDSTYIPILKFVMRSNSIDILNYFDRNIEEQQKMETSIRDTSYWQHGTFLNYLKTDLLVDTKDSIKEEAKAEIFRFFFGGASFFYPNKRAINLVNYILEVRGDSVINYTLSDTARFGFTPEWLEI